MGNGILSTKEIIITNDYNGINLIKSILYYYNQLFVNFKLVDRDKKPCAIHAITYDNIIMLIILDYGKYFYKKKVVVGKDFIIDYNTYQDLENAIKLSVKYIDSNREILKEFNSFLYHIYNAKLGKGDNETILFIYKTFFVLDDYFKYKYINEIKKKDKYFELYIKNFYIVNVWFDYNNNNGKILEYNNFYYLAEFNSMQELYVLLVNLFNNIDNFYILENIDELLENEFDDMSIISFSMSNFSDNYDLSFFEEDFEL
jgi:hypothetical protein